MSNFLETLDPTLQEAIRKAGVLVRFGPGESVFSRGDPGRAMYIISCWRVWLKRVWGRRSPIPTSRT